MDDTGIGTQDAGRIAELQGELAEARREIGSLRLQLDVLSTTDLVTGLPNHHGMIEIVERAVQRLDRSGEPFGLMSIEVPEVEMIEQRHGAGAAKEALRHAGALIAASLRQVDQVGRLDGAVFLVALPELDARGADVVADRIGELLGSVPMSLGDVDWTLVPSISVVLSTPGRTVGTVELLERATRARSRAVPNQPLIVAASLL